MTRLVDVLLPGLLSQPIQQVELFLALALAGAMRLRVGWLDTPAALWRRLERRPLLTLSAVAVCLLSAHAALEWQQPRRSPAVHDEFGYLLTARTLLEGRLTNPTPPEWRALDTVHVNFVPSYNSMYPPGQPLLLALAWRGLGHPVYANWTLAALLGLGAWWMLAAWVPRRWALFGGLLVAMRLGLFGYWAESYMGGALPALCAFLFAGALPRAVRRPSMLAATCAGLALGALFGCRPFEAVVLGVCATPMPWLLPRSAHPRAVLLNALPGVLLFGLVVTLVAWHNAALTGSPLRFGYDLNMERHGYGVFPGSRTVGTEPAVTPHLASFYDEARAYATYGWTPGGFVGTRLRSLGWAWIFLVGPLLTLGSLHWRHCLAVRRLRPALPGLLSFWVIVVATPWSFAHYYSGALGFLLVFSITGIRLWCVRHRISPARAAGSIVIAGGIVVLVRILGGVAVVPSPPAGIEWLPYNTPAGLDARDRLEDTLADTQPALVFVRYGPRESVRRSWVYNAPNPTQAPVVWANDLGPSQNARTAQAYAGRQWHCIELEAGRPSRADCALWVGPLPERD